MKLKFKNEHSNNYDFAGGMGLPEVFINVFDTKFHSNGEKNLIYKCLFIIASYQSAAVNGGLPISDCRFWSTKTYEGFYFNDFVKTSLILIFVRE